MEEFQLNDEYVKQFIDSNKAKNTVKKTRSDLNGWYRWCETAEEHRKLEDIPQVYQYRINHLSDSSFVEYGESFHSPYSTLTRVISIMY